MTIINADERLFDQKQKPKQGKKCPDGPCPKDPFDCKGAGWGCYSHHYTRAREATARKVHECKYGFKINPGTRYRAETCFLVPWSDQGGSTVAVDWGKKCVGVNCQTECFEVVDLIREGL